MNKKINKELSEYFQKEEMLKKIKKDIKIYKRKIFSQAKKKQADEYIENFGDIDLLKLFIKNKYDLNENNVFTCYRLGNIENMELLIKYKQDFDNGSVWLCVQKAKYENLKLCLEDGYTVGTGYITNTLIYGKLKNVKFLIKHKMNLDDRVISFLAEAADIEFIKKFYNTSFSKIYEK